jgi:hypothetical protein
MQVGGVRVLDKPKGLSPQGAGRRDAQLCEGREQALRQPHHLQYNSRGYLMRAIITITTSTRTSITPQCQLRTG